MYKLSDAINELMLSMHAQQKEYNSRQLPNTIISAVSKALSLEYDDVVSHCRKRELVDARHIISFILAKNSELNLREIGELLGGRDHTTVIASVNAYQLFIDSRDKKFIEKIELVKAELKEGLCV